MRSLHDVTHRAHRFTLAVGIFLSLHTVSLAQTVMGGPWASHSLDKVLRSATAPTGTAASNPVRAAGCRGETVSGQRFFFQTPTCNRFRPASAR